ncbi:hypothetical protein [Labilithrix luteola]|nr:hypothetical protein [Labilithrix luteola]
MTKVSDLLTSEMHAAIQTCVANSTSPDDVIVVHMNEVTTDTTFAVVALADYVIASKKDKRLRKILPYIQKPARPGFHRLVLFRDPQGDAFTANIGSVPMAPGGVA